MIHIEVDTQAEIVRIGQRLERLAFQAPDILRCPSMRRPARSESRSPRTRPKPTPSTKAY